MILKVCTRGKQGARGRCAYEEVVDVSVCEKRGEAEGGRSALCSVVLEKRGERLEVGDLR